MPDYDCDPSANTNLFLAHEFINQVEVDHLVSFWPLTQCLHLPSSKSRERLDKTYGPMSAAPVGHRQRYRTGSMSHMTPRPLGVTRPLPDLRTAPQTATRLLVEASRTSPSRAPMRNCTHSHLRWSSVGLQGTVAECTRPLRSKPVSDAEPKLQP